LSARPLGAHHARTKDHPPTRQPLPRQPHRLQDGNFNETQVRVEFIDPLFKAFGWDIHNELGYAEAYKDVIHEHSIKIGDATKAPDYCFRIGGNAPRVKALKHKHLGNPRAIFHSRDIRRLDGPFRCLRDSKERKQAFYEDLDELVTGLRVRLFAVAIDKRRLHQRFLFPPNPYDVSLSQLLSLVCGPPGTPAAWRPYVARLTAESRGKREDKELQAEYQRFRRSGLWNYGAAAVQDRRPGTVRRVYPERIDFVTKDRGVVGLELADLAAYPIGRAVVSANLDNPAFQVVSRKLKSLLVFP
jgi:hypothetical protein